MEASVTAKVAQWGQARKLFYGSGCQWAARVAVNQQPEEVWVHEGVGSLKMAAGWSQLKHSSGTGVPQRSWRNAPQAAAF